MNKSILLPIMVLTLATGACTTNGKKKEVKEDQPFKVQTEQFADAKIIRYQVPGFDSLSLN